jgi:hypothetical protein
VFTLVCICQINTIGAPNWGAQGIVVPRCDTQDVTTVEPLSEKTSKLVFGNIHMNKVMLEIAAVHGETFSPKQIVEATGIAFGTINPIIHKLRDAEFIELVGRAEGERTLVYRIVENPWWDAARQYVQDRPTTD